MRRPITVTIGPCGGGVVKDIPANELQPNQWSDSLNMRFSNGIAQRRGGIRAGWTAHAVQPYALHTLVTTSGTRFVVEAGIAKVYVDDGTTQTEITRFTAGVSISSMTAAGTTVTVTTASNHGRTTGDAINVWGATETAYNVTNKVITVTAATTFTYVADSAPAAPASVVGQYELRVADDFTGAIDDRWTLSVFNGILILNNPVDGPYYWAGDTTIRMRRLPGWASADKAYAMRTFKNFLIALAPTISGTFKPHTIMWSTSAEAGSVPSSWTAASTNDAGDTPQAAETPGFLIDGMGLGDEFYVYDQDSIFGLSYISGGQVFSLRRLPAIDGLRSRSCVVNTPKGQVWLSNEDVLIHAGGEAQSIAEGRIKRWLSTYIDGTYAARAFLATNPAYSEVWVVFPSFGQAVPDWAAVWNWRDDTWSLYELPAVTCATTGLIAGGVDSEAWEDLDFTWEGWNNRWYTYEHSPNEQRLILAAATTLALAESGNTDLGTAISWRLEKTGSTLGDNDSMKVISRSRPQIIAQAGTQFTVTHTTTLQASDTPVYPATVTYTAGTSEWANRFSKAGRFLAVKYEGSAEPTIALRSYDVEFSKQGRF